MFSKCIMEVLKEHTMSVAFGVQLGIRMAENEGRDPILVYYVNPFTKGLIDKVTFSRQLEWVIDNSLDDFEVRHEAN